ncbi:hypothetical protein B0H14DRAFT_3624804 [Mycena olivaceomarginata]|nr:hypothetical protein B0H14DRAFT_3624804 [Mycena olivaceomarginata]
MPSLTQWWTGFNSPPVLYLLPLFFFGSDSFLRRTHASLYSVRDIRIRGTRRSCTVHPPDQLKLDKNLSGGRGIKIHAASAGCVRYTHRIRRRGRPGMQRWVGQTNSVKVKLKFNLFKVQGCMWVQRVGTSEQFQRALSKARKERTRTSTGTVGLGQEGSSAIEQVGLAFSSCCDWGGEAATGYVQAVGARARLAVRCGEDEEAAEDGDDGGGVELRAGTKLSQLDVQLPRARAYERRDGDAPASPRAAYPGASGIAGVVVVGGVIRIRARQRLAAPMHHSYRALRKRVRVLVYASVELRHGGGRDERREECARELVAEKEEAVGEGGACEASEEQGHSDESGEGGGESGARGNASGAEVEARSYCAARGRPEQRRVDAGRGLGRSGGLEGEPPPPHDERRRALLELAEHQAHAGGAARSA